MIFSFFFILDDKIGIRFRLLKLRSAYSLWFLILVRVIGFGLWWLKL